MRITADLHPAREMKPVDLPEGASGDDLLRCLQLAPDAHILVRGEVPISIDEPLMDGERVRVISIVSGG